MGTRYLLREQGPVAFAKWTASQQRLLLTDTTFRDAHQSLLATRMRTFDLLRIANFVSHRLPGLYSLEMWGGATFDVAMRFLLEDPWQRLRQLREAIPNICFQMLFRASNAVGYTAYPNNVIRGFVKEAYSQGMDIFRIFDSLNYLPNMTVAMEAVRETGAVCEAAVCYTGDILDPAREKYSLNYYIRMARELEKMGAHVLAIKDMAGLLRPYAAQRLVTALRESIGLPVHFHTHDTSGINAASILKASEAGVNVCDAALASMSGTTSQPNLNSIVAALQHTERATGLDLAALNACSDYWETVRGYYLPFDSGPKTGSAEVYLHEMPGGQITNLKEQADAMGLGQRWPEIAQTYADVNFAFGDIVKVTPSSKVVGDLAIFLITHNMTVAEFSQLGTDHQVPIPNSVVDMFEGSLGEPEGGWPTKIRDIVLQGREPKRPQLPDADFAKRAAELSPELDREATTDEVLSSLLYPDVFLKFARARRSFGDVEVLPTPQFFFGMEKGEEILVTIEEGKSLVIKFLTVGEARDDGFRTVFYELNGQSREVDVRDKSLEVRGEQRAKADPGNPLHIGAPLPGLVTTVAVAEGGAVKKGDRLLVIEAMKMQSTVYAPATGKVQQVLVKAGQQVDAKDLLLVMS